jgi:hypothetical protein
MHFETWDLNTPRKYISLIGFSFKIAVFVFLEENIQFRRKNPVKNSSSLERCPNLVLRKYFRLI